MIFLLLVANLISNVSWGVQRSNFQNDLKLLPSLLLDQSDSTFDGYFFDIDKVLTSLRISRHEAHEIQNVFRDQLETLSGSGLRAAQKPFLRTAFTFALERVLDKKTFETGWKPISFQDHEFIIVLDLDETLLSQWYDYGTRVEKSLGNVSIASFDTQVSDTYFVGDAKREQVFSPTTVVIRPGVSRLFETLAEIPGYRGFVLFSAKHDAAAVKLVQEWKKKEEALFSRFLGLFTRNHLRLDSQLEKPSKDLRIFDETLEHVFLIDDNESRVMQKQLNYRIPKFNPDRWIEALQGTSRSVAYAEAVRDLNQELLAYVGTKMNRCQAPQITKCFSNSLRTSMSPLEAFYQDMRRRQPDLAQRAPLSTLVEDHVFDEPIHGVLRSIKIQTPAAGSKPAYR